MEYQIHVQNGTPLVGKITDYIKEKIEGAFGEPQVAVSALSREDYEILQNDGFQGISEKELDNTERRL